MRLISIRSNRWRAGGNYAELVGCPSCYPVSTYQASVLRQRAGRFVLRDNEDTRVVADSLLQPVFCLRAGERYDADASILPEAVAA